MYMPSGGGSRRVSLVNARFAKPVDEQLLRSEQVDGLITLFEQTPHRGVISAAQQ